MGKGGGVLLLLIAIFIAYLGASGRYKCFTKMLLCISGKCDCDCAATTTAKTTTSTPSKFAAPALFQIPPIPKIGNLNAL